jgi:hypothetical protein
MSNPCNALASLLHPFGVAGSACSRAFQGSDAPACLTNRTGDGKIKLGNHLLDRLPVYRLGLAVSAALLTLSFGVATAGAAIPSEFGSLGSGAGQFESPTGSAVNQATGDVYVIDYGNHRVDEFSGEGVFIRAFGWDVNAAEPKEEAQVCTTATGCRRGSPGSGPGQFEYPDAVGGIAVDNDPLDFGSVYVVDSRNHRVEKFSSEGHFELQIATGGQAVAVGSTGTLYVGEAGAVQEYMSAGAKIGGPFTLEGAVAITALAVDAAGEIYASEGSDQESSISETHTASRYSATGALLGVFDSEPEGSARALAMDQATGEIFVLHRLAGSQTDQIRGFSAAGVELTAFADATERGRNGLSFGEQTGVLYTTKSTSNHAGTASFAIEVIARAARGPEVSQESAEHVEPTAAVVHAVINPETNPADAGDETAYRVEYGSCASAAACAGAVYEHSVPSPEGTLPPSFNEEEIPGVPSSGLGVPLSGLSPRTKYHYRVHATNQCEKTPPVISTCETLGENSTFETQPPALIEAGFSTEVRSTSATLHATINPLGAATEYHFEYDTRPYALGEAGHGTSIPVPGEQLGSGKAGVAVEQHVQGLSAGQTYYYRVVTANTIAGIPEVEEGAEREFTTQTGGEAGLPDNRQWELVSPPDKHGSKLGSIQEGTYLQAAADGDGIAYWASSPTEAEPHGNGEIIQVLAQRTNSGWGNIDLAAPHAGLPSGFEPQMPYRAFSSDLSTGALQPIGSFEPALSKEANEQTSYLRDSTTGLFTPLVTRADDTTSPFIPFGEESEGVCVNIICGPEFLGATPDFSHIVLGPGGNGHRAPLLEGTPANSLYEWAGGKLSLVSQLPAETPPAVEEAPSLGGSGGGEKGTVTAHAISNDGSRIFWSQQPVHGIGATAGLLFMRDMRRGETIEIGTGEVGFEGANTAGTLVFYSGKECEVVLEGAGLKCDPVREAGGKPVEDGLVLANSEDGSWVYFRQGESIYVRHGSEPAKLVASATGNIRDPSQFNTEEQRKDIRPDVDPWRASPDGEWFAFMSDSPLTGYDNHDAVTGQPDEEVYLYSAAAKRLVCASCDPSGARPHGGTLLQYVEYTLGWLNKPIAASIPGWAPYQNDHALYDPRFLSDSGRLFFNSVGGLVPKDVNEQVDVYELEPAGVGSCTTATQTGTIVYSPAAAGCVALISNGESNEESVFEDASESGEDVFFLSSSRLSTADLDGSLSLWDAHVCGAEGVPCTSAPVSPPACTTEASCKASPSPQPAIYGAPASATFNGPGNVAPAPTVTKKVTKKTVKCKKGLVKNKKGRCVKKPKRKSKKAKKTNRGAKS